jgi:hypothetical protein
MRKCRIILFMAVLGPLNSLGQRPTSSVKYFPDSSLDLRRDHFKSDWYSVQLDALQEPSLYQMANTPNAESYRFLWLRSFNNPIAVRLDPKPDGTSVLTTKVASGAGGFRPGVLTENSSHLLTREQTKAFLSKVTEVGFWDAPNPVNDQRGTDGSQWIIEGVKGNHYHVVDRWSPTNGVARQLGLLLALDLAKIAMPKNDIY